jgi:hypothetical protein
MDESIDTQDQGIAVDLRCTFRKKAGFQFVQHIPGNSEKKGILTISNIRDVIRKRFKVLFRKFFLITFVWEEPFPGVDLADEIPVIAAPFATGEFDCTIFVNTVYTIIITYPCTFTDLKRVTSSGMDDFLTT